MFKKQYTTRPCAYCGDPIKGRDDKRFCNDGCRNSFNNETKRGRDTRMFKDVRASLNLNRRILLKFSPARKNYAKVSAFDLLRNGYNFHYCTHFTTLCKKKLTCCFDVGFVELEKSILLVIRLDKLKENKKLDFDLI
jgi:predicted nucleic acid-binding Zn ribbon protein